MGRFSSPLRHILHEFRFLYVRHASLMAETEVILETSVFLSVLPLTVASGQRACLRPLFDHRNNICRGLKMMNLLSERL
jgi:hypothetical protein